MRYLLLPLYLAYKSLWPKNPQSSVKIVSYLSFICLSLASFTLALVWMIMSGYQEQLLGKLQGLQADADITMLGQGLNFLEGKKFLQNLPADVVQDFCGVSSGQALLKHADGLIPIGVFAMEADRYTRVGKMGQHIIQQLPLSEDKDLLALNNIIIGYKLAAKYNWRLGETITLLLPSDFRGDKLKLQRFNVVIAGLLKTDWQEYDQGMILCGLPFWQNASGQEGLVESFWLTFDRNPVFAVGSTNPIFALFQNGLLGLKRLWGQFGQPWIQLRLSKLAPLLQEKIVLRGWQERHPELIRALRLERAATILVLALILFLALSTLMAMLALQLQIRKRALIILRCFGFNLAQLWLMFASMAVLQTGFASVVGLLVAWLSAWFLQSHPLFFLPGDYTSECLFLTMHPSLFITIIFITCALALLWSLPLLGFLCGSSPARLLNAN